MKSLSYLNKYFIKYKWRFLLGIIFIVISNYFGVKMPMYVKSTFDQFIENSSFTNMKDTFMLAIKIGGIYMLLSLASGVFLFLTRQTIIIMSRLIEYDLKNEIYQQYQKLDYAFYKKNATGDLMNRISEDVSQVRMYLGPGIMYSINLVALFFLVIFQMIDISPKLTLFVLIPLPIMSFLIYKVSTKMNTLSKEIQHDQSFLSTIAQETFAGIRIIKAYNREKEAQKRFNETAQSYKKKNMSLVIVNSLFMPTIMFLIGLSTLIAIYLGGLMKLDNSITPGGIIAFIFFVNKLTWPFASIGWVTSINQRAAASQTRINEFLKIQPTLVNQNFEPFELKGKIEFKNVNFTYDNSGIQAIKNLSFTIQPGETFAIIGRTGSGKTTVIQLLMRQYEINSGQILIDGKDIKEINLDNYRSQTGVVPQDVFLFSDTIANNITFGAKEKEVPLAIVEENAKKTHVYDNIISFPGQFETILGERGVNLSGGQKQRISIARALIRNPKLLILDDCLSAVDTETEEIILNNLKKEASHKTCLIVSHRISSLRNADRIIIIENGEKMEEGTHVELMQKNGMYKDMYLKQLAAEINS